MKVSGSKELSDKTPIGYVVTDGEGKPWSLHFLVLYKSGLRLDHYVTDEYDSGDYRYRKVSWVVPGGIRKGLRQDEIEGLIEEFGPIREPLHGTPVVKPLCSETATPEDFL